MKPPLLIGITGARQNGKDTLLMRINALGGDFYRLALADALKESLSVTIKDQFGWDISTLDCSRKEVLRPLFIGHGMAWRKVDPLHWVKIVDGKMRLMTSNDYYRNFCITDFRFPNEVEFFKHYYKDQFHLIEVTREGAPDPTDEEKKHVKEMSKLADYHVKWGNDNTQQQLQVAKKVLNWIKEQRYE